MNLYYDTKTKTATHIESETTIISTDKRVEAFFMPLTPEQELIFDEKSLPLIRKKVISLDELKNLKLFNILTTYQTKSTANVPYKDVLYKGGDASAGAISGAVTLAQSLQESNVKIIASDDSANEMSFNEALELSGLIAKEWRTAFFRYKELKLQISNAATVEELDLISWEEV